MHTKMNVSLLVNTKDRPSFIDRLLSYYSYVGFDGDIVLFDSSCESVRQDNKRMVDEHQNKLNITYLYLPGANVIEAQAEMISCADTKYTILNNDDDLYVPSGIQRCIEFLDEHKEYVAANGIGIQMKMKDPGPYGRILSTLLHPMTSIDDDTALERLMHHLPNYTVSQWSVYRKDIFLKTYRNPLVDNNYNYHSGIVGEMTPACLGPVLGKIKHFDDVLFFIRQFHAERWLSSSYGDWVNSDIFKEDRERFCRYFSSVISEIDDIDEGFVYAVVTGLFEDYIKRNRGRSDLKLNQFFSRIPYVRVPLRIVKDMAFHTNEKYSVKNLIRNPDFNVLYQLIMNGGAL